MSCTHLVSYMPTGGFTCRELAEVLGVSPTKVTQAWDPAVHKIAQAMLADPLKTIRAIVEEAERIEIARVPAMPDAEIDERRLMLAGGVDRCEVPAAPGSPRMPRPLSAAAVRG